MEEIVEQFSPDEEGQLSLQFQGWTDLMQPFFHNISAIDQILSLDISNNCITLIPNEISELIHLAMFNCSSNKIKDIPDYVGTLVELKVFKAKCNNINNLSLKIGDCIKLEELYLSENQIEALPDSITRCKRLRILQVQNNKLHSLPFALGTRHRTLEMDVSNNPYLNRIIPKEMQDKSEAIFFMLNYHHEQKQKIQNIMHVIQDLRKNSHDREKALREVQMNISRVKEDSDRLLLERIDCNFYLGIKTSILKMKRAINKAIAKSI